LFNSQSADKKSKPTRRFRRLDISTHGTDKYISQNNLNTSELKTLLSLKVFTTFSSSENNELLAKCVFESHLANAKNKLQQHTLESALIVKVECQPVLTGEKPPTGEGLGFYFKLL